MSVPKRRKVRRVIEIEGEASWVENILFHSALNPENPIKMGFGTIREVSRKEILFLEKGETNVSS